MQFAVWTNGGKIATSQHIQLSESKTGSLSVLLDVLMRSGLPSVLILFRKTVLL